MVSQVFIKHNINLAHWISAPPRSILIDLAKEQEPPAAHNSALPFSAHPLELQHPIATLESPDIPGWGPVGNHIGNSVDSVKEALGPGRSSPSRLVQYSLLLAEVGSKEEGTLGRAIPGRNYGRADIGFRSIVAIPAAELN
jgi:hypothetical protein